MLFPTPPAFRPDRRRFVELSALGALGAAFAGSARPQQANRPRYRLTTTEKFDAATVPPYRGNHAAIYRHIDANLDRHVANLQRWLRQPSVSAQSVGIEQMATMVRDDLKNMGFKEAELVPTDGHPGVWGYCDAGAPKTLMVYMMYDVQPVDPEDLLYAFAAA